MIRRKLWKPALGLIAMVSPLAIIASCSNQEQNTTDQPGDDGVDKPQFNLDLNTRIERQKQIVDFNNRFDKILKTDVKRNVQTQSYETDLLKKYGSGFKYPAWDYNYRASTNGKPNHLQHFNGQDVNAFDLVWDEYVTWKQDDGTEVKTRYNNVDFILNEIKHGRLKKHPAADGMFGQKIDDRVGSVVKAFSIGGNIKGPSPLGLYLAPGEVATIQFSQKTLDLMKQQNINDLRLMISGSFYDNKPNTDATGKMSNRYPFMMSQFTMPIDDLIANNGKFQFGSPFGGSIDLVVNTKLKNPNANPFYPSYENFEFQISGALETLLYVHGETTKADWDQQIEKIKNDQIQAPIMAIDFPYGSMQLQSTGPKQFVGVDYDKIVFPEAIMNRWTDFLFLSNLFASRDLNDSLIKIHFRFNADIPFGGAAWGGNEEFKAPLKDAANGFLKGDGGWTIPGQWLVFHEINHNFEQNQVLFKKQSHEETNQVTMFNLSVLSDGGRYRNPYNWTGGYSPKNKPGWNRVQSGFSSNRWIQTNGWKGKNSEYEIQNHLLQLVGTYKFLEYVQQDAATGSNKVSGWTGFKEILELSEFFQLNFWPALQKFSPWWFDTWPTTYEKASDWEKQQIDELNKKYKAFDFVANVYAAGNYLWDQKTEQYLYTSDMQVPIDVSATGKYYFDFEKGINAPHPNFKWNELQYQATTKLGGTLTPDPRNPKVLIYQPPAGHEGEIDEFDMAIIPDYTNDIHKKATYVDRYGFKIKMFLNPRGPVVSLYENVLTENKDTFAQDEFAYMTDEKNISFSTISDPSRGIIHDQMRWDTKTEWPDKEWQRMKISFDFVAPKAGSYQIQYQGDARVFVTKDYNNDQIWFDGSNQVASTNPYTIDQTLYLSQYESVHFDFYISANPNKTKFRVNAVHLPTGEIYNAYQNSTVGNLAIANEAALYDEKYQYHHRKVDLNKFQTKLFGNRVPNTSWSVDKSNPDQAYTISFNSASTNVNNDLKNSADQKLGTQDNNVWELWGPKDGSKLEVTFDIDFVKPQTIGAVIIGHRTNNHYEARPTKIKVVDQNQNVLYDGSYGTQFNDRSQAQAITNLNKLATNVTKLTITLINEKVWGSPLQSALSIDHIGFTNQQNVGLNKILPMLDPTISYYGNDWNRIKNDPDVILSDVNFEAIGTSTAGHYLQFSLYANSFDLIGQKLPSGTEFDLYINDQLVGTYNTSNPIRVDNAILATYQNAQPQWMNVRIVNKSDKPFRLNYIQTYGKHVEWKPWRS